MAKTTKTATIFKGNVAKLVKTDSAGSYTAIGYNFVADQYVCKCGGAMVRDHNHFLTCQANRNCQTIVALDFDEWASDLRYSYWASQTNRAISAHLVAKFDAMVIKANKRAKLVNDLKAAVAVAVWAAAVVGGLVITL